MILSCSQDALYVDVSDRPVRAYADRGGAGAQCFCFRSVVTTQHLLTSADAKGHAAVIPTALSRACATAIGKGALCVAALTLNTLSLYLVCSVLTALITTRVVPWAPTSFQQRRPKWATSAKDDAAARPPKFGVHCNVL